MSQPKYVGLTALYSVRC